MNSLRCEFDIFKFSRKSRWFMWTSVSVRGHIVEPGVVPAVMKQDIKIVSSVSLIHEFFYSDDMHICAIKYWFFCGIAWCVSFRIHIDIFLIRTGTFHTGKSLSRYAQHRWAFLDRFRCQCQPPSAFPRRNKGSFTTVMRRFLIPFTGPCISMYARYVSVCCYLVT